MSACTDCRHPDAVHDALGCHDNNVQVGRQVIQYCSCEREHRANRSKPGFNSGATGYIRGRTNTLLAEFRRQWITRSRLEPAELARKAAEIAEELSWAGGHQDVVSVETVLSELGYSIVDDRGEVDHAIDVLQRYDRFIYGSDTCTRCGHRFAGSAGADEMSGGAGCPNCCDDDPTA